MNATRAVALHQFSAEDHARFRPVVASPVVASPVDESSAVVIPLVASSARSAVAADGAAKARAATPAAISRAAIPVAPSSPLRLTRRGRVVVAALAALLVTVLSLIASGAAQATNHPVPPRAARQNVAQVVVRSGQSLWSVAESADPNADTRLVIQQIVELNALSGDVVFAGQRLLVPRG